MCYVLLVRCGAVLDPAVDVRADDRSCVSRLDSLGRGARRLGRRRRLCRARSVAEHRTKRHVDGLVLLVVYEAKLGVLEQLRDRFGDLKRLGAQRLAVDREEGVDLRV